MESEIAFMLGEDLPVREAPLHGSGCARRHRRLPIRRSNLCSRALPRPRLRRRALANLADLIRHGAFVWGPAIENWEAIDFPMLSITQTIEGGPAREGVGQPRRRHDAG